MKIVLASGNQGKVKEFNSLLADMNMQVVPQSELGIEGAEETGLTFIENAILKARHASRLSGLPALADDSGIAIDALGGKPGIYSARYAGDDKANIERVLAELDGMLDAFRGAQFHCALVYMRHAEDPCPLICQGVWRGKILTEQRGEGGFGYDPIFWVEEHQCSAAELSKETKNQISHRGQAIKQLQSMLSSVGLN